jgi:5-methyltetrahydrofolate--homocysteine methyltransferase
MSDSKFRVARLKEALAERLVLGDGSTGSALSSLAGGGYERLALFPLERPELVRALHEAYLEAGSEVIETATFTASARGVAGLVPIGQDPVEFAYRLNFEAARIARVAADRAQEASGGPRWVAGSMGPGDAPPSLGASSYAELKASYLPQARGLADGGADFAILETCQDPLQIKAAIAALASGEGGRGLPFVVSATMDSRGLLLTGTDIDALVAIIAPFGPLAIGLNCSGGPDELEAPLARLAAISPFPLGFMPNAGLPREEGGRTLWPLGPEDFAAKVEGLARRYGVALVGGCCGTFPAHIERLSARLADRPRPSARPRPSPALASLYAARPVGPALFRIGERANAAGSSSFAAAIEAEDFDGAAALAVRQEAIGKTAGGVNAGGAAALDLHVSRPGRDEAADLSALASRLSGLARSALCLDSSDPEALARALPSVGGRPILNSTSLEDPERARRVFALAKEFGAAVVCLALDDTGPAKSTEGKVRVCRSLYEMATAEFSLEPSSLFFDPLTFTVAAGPSGSALETLRALPLIKKACPGSFTILGVGNISYGLPKKTRPAVTSIFLSLAREAGLDAAILDCGIPEPGAVPPEVSRAARALILGKAEEGYDPMEALLAASGGLEKLPRAPGPAGTDTDDPEASLRSALLRGDSRAALRAARSIVDATRGDGPARLSAVVSASMAEAGRLWNRGDLPLPLVLRSAEAARAALDALRDSPEASQSKGTVIMATVKGDLHDIGKNIVGAILSCSGYRVVDLGIDVSPERILGAAQGEGCVAVGLSGLLTRSLSEMRKVCGLIDGSSPRTLVLAGGAAADPRYVRDVLDKEHPGLVKPCSDAFETIGHLEAFLGKGPEKVSRGSLDEASEAAPPSGKAPLPIAPSARTPSIEAPWLGARVLAPLDSDELFEALDRNTLYAARWGYRRADFAEAARELDRIRALVGERGLLDARAVYGFFNCRREGEANLRVDDPAAPGKTRSFSFPVEKPYPRRCLTQYFSEAGDIFPAFAATVGARLPAEAASLREAGKMEEYWRLHGLASALAEAMAEIAHRALARALAGSGLSEKASRGRRYSFGFPACPGLEFQGELLALLGAERIGISLSGGFELVPEHSVTAFMVAREDAEYLSFGG